MSSTSTHAKERNTRTFSFVKALVNPSLFHQKSSLWNKLLVRMETYLKGKCFNRNRMLNWKATLNSLRFKNYFHKLLIWETHIIFLFCIFMPLIRFLFFQPKFLPIIQSWLCFILQHGDSYQITTCVNFHLLHIGCPHGPNLVWVKKIHTLQAIFRFQPFFSYKLTNITKHLKRIYMYLLQCKEKNEMKIL